MNSKTADDLPKLTPIIHPWVNRCLRQKKLINRALRIYGSPINIHNTIPFEENVRKFKSIFEKYGLKHRIYFARKANKCISFPKAAYTMGEAIDTASLRELSQCLSLGIPGRKIITTAAVKNQKLLKTAVNDSVPIVVDNDDECLLIQSIGEETGLEIPVIIRVSHFVQNGEKLYSRFGFPVDHIADWIRMNLGENQKYNKLSYRGLHFHLNGYSFEHRAIALCRCLDAIKQLKAYGFETKSLDMGGGFLVNYLLHKYQWDSFFTELKSALLGKRSQITFANDGLGYRVYKGNIIGEPNVYPFYNELNKEKVLEAILTYQCNGGSPLWKRISDSQVELRIEPGRSLLDQAGITIARVCFRKKDTEDNLLIGVEMNRTQLRSSSADFLLDPIHIPIEKTSSHPSSGYLVGAYCLEQELILKRKISFSTLPKVGDWIVFPNTAGYMMHFYESEAHLFELATNLFYKENDLVKDGS
ncbi:hypothetical protein [Membranihabitans maritimus]|uniref:hypothetical protein n=1 Tax=Membranihabitans maritimus TaxID=2904244 RepID=UPI001F2D232C|nr:hypothetical protein [Membranihabitans maritimus]